MATHPLREPFWKQNVFKWTRELRSLNDYPQQWTSQQAKSSQETLDRQKRGRLLGSPICDKKGTLQGAGRCAIRAALKLATEATEDAEMKDGRESRLARLKTWGGAKPGVFPLSCDADSYGNDALAP